MAPDCTRHTGVCFQEVSEPRVSMARPSAVGLSARRMPQRQSTTPNRARPQTQVRGTWDVKLPRIAFFHSCGKI